MQFSEVAAETSESTKSSPVITVIRKRSTLSAALLPGLTHISPPKRERKSPEKRLRIFVFLSCWNFYLPVFLAKITAPDSMVRKFRINKPDPPVFKYFFIKNYFNNFDFFIILQLDIAPTNTRFTSKSNYTSVFQSQRSPEKVRISGPQKNAGAAIEVKQKPQICITKEIVFVI